MTRDFALDRPFFAAVIAAIVCAVALAGCGDKRGDVKKPGDKVDKKNGNDVKLLVDVNVSKSVPDKDAAKDALRSALAWLKKTQAADGGWKSDTYGPLKGGAATTAVVMYALARVPEGERDGLDAALERGWKFLQPGVEQKGYVVNPDGSADYATYASALVLAAAECSGLKLGDARGTLVKFVIDSQLDETQKWTPDDVHYGGWDFVGASAPDERNTIGTNLSITSFALEAISKEKTTEADEARSKARVWLARCQNAGDGGFHFSPVAKDLANKAGRADGDNPRPNAYGTPTCDAVRALTACGAKADDPLLKSAIDWLTKNKQVATPPGLHDDGRDGSESGWADGLRLYYYTGLASALKHLPADEQAPRREALLDSLLKLQAKSGEFANDSFKMREDDPLIATALAVIALSEICAPAK